MESFLDISPHDEVKCKWKVYFTSMKVIIVKNRLADIRKSRNITQEQLASQLRVSRQTIGSIENGRYNPSLLLAFRIAELFELPIEKIFIYNPIRRKSK